MQDENTSYFTSNTPKNQLVADETATERTDPLKIKIEDKELVRIVDKRIKDYDKFYNGEKFNLKERRSKNELYYFGRQIAELEKQGRIKDYEAKNLDNVLYEIEATIKPLAMSQLPDLIVTPGNESDQSRETAKLLSRGIDTDVKKRINRKVLALAFKHRPVYFVGVIKARWNPELAGGLGDYEYIVIHPDNIEFDFHANEADADKMRFISQICEDTVETLFLRFPRAKDKLIEQLQKDGILSENQKPTWKALATTLKYREVWFDEYEKLEDGKVRKILGVLWKYKEVILEKMKNPNFDYVGESQVFTYTNPEIKSSRRILTLPEMQQSLVTGMFPANSKKEQIYHNYFDSPRKPFYFMVYDQWGKQPLDETTSLEQNAKNQEALDNIIKVVQEKLRNRGHHVWSKESGLKPDDIEKMDHNNPDEDYLVDGGVRDVHEFILGEQPTQQEFAEKDNIRNRMFALAGANAVRGTLQSEIATSNQIAREANYTRADDLVDDTINAAAEWMAAYALQFIKLRYTQGHFRKILGKKGEIVFLRLHQNMIEEGMEVMIKASGTDKIKAQNNAMEMARMQLVDPLTFFTDMGLDDPEGRTVKLMLFTKDPASYLTQFIENNPNITQDLLARLQTLPLTQSQGQPGQPPQGMPQNPTPTNTAQVPAQPPQGVPASPSAAPPMA